MLTPPWHLILLPIFFLWTLDRFRTLFFIATFYTRNRGTVELLIWESPPPPSLPHSECIGD